MRKVYLLIAILLIPASLMAIRLRSGAKPLNPAVITPAPVAKGGGGGGNVLVGNNTDETTEVSGLNPNWAYGYKFTAVKTGKIASGKVKIYDNISNDGKLLVTDASGNILGYGTFTTQDTSVAEWRDVTFVGSISITNGQQYGLFIICNGYVTCYANSDSYKMGFDWNGSYTTPPDPVSFGNNIAGIPAFYVVD